MKTSRIYNQSGSAILAILIFAIILSGIIGTYLKVSLDEMKYAQRTLRLQSAMNVAEAAAEQAIKAILDDKWTGWTQVQSKQYYKDFNATYFLGYNSDYRAFVNLTDPNSPVLLCEGIIRDQFGEVSKQIKIDLGRRSLFANGLTAKDTVSFSGGNVTIDSYNSLKGPYGLIFGNLNDRGTVGSTSVDADAVNLSNAKVYGFVATGGGYPNVGPNGTVSGLIPKPGVRIDPDRITTDFYATFDPVKPPTMTSPITTIPPSGIIGTPGSTVPTAYKISSLNLKSSDKLIVNGPVIIHMTGDLDVRGEIEITSKGKVELYIAGDVSVGGNGVINLTNRPENLLIYGLSTAPNQQEIKLHGNGALVGAVYAPFADLNLKGGGNSGTFFGAGVAQNISLNGNYAFHYDEALDSFGADNSFRIIRWKELILATERGDFDKPSTLPPLATKSAPPKQTYPN